MSVLQKWHAILKFTNVCSRKRISPIDKNVAPSRKSRSITGEVKVQTLDFLCMSLAAERRHAVGLIDGKWACTHFGTKEAGRDDINASELPPLPGKGLSEMGGERFASVVNWLVGGYVDDMRAHTGRYDQVPAGLTLEYLASVLGTEDDTVDWVVGSAWGKLISREMEVLPLTFSCFSYSSSFCSKMGFEMAIPVPCQILPCVT